jgi:hypothetical protein
MADLDTLEMLLRALPFDERLALELAWEDAGTPLGDRLAQAEAAAQAADDGCSI